MNKDMTNYNNDRLFKIPNGNYKAKEFDRVRKHNYENGWHKCHPNLIGFTVNDLHTLGYEIEMRHYEEAPEITVITHGGAAHVDDYLAICLLMGYYKDNSFVIHRRNPTKKELKDPKVFVVDIGGEHDANKLNFDHHQFERDHEPVCAVSLVLQHLGLYNKFKEFFKWLDFVEYMDCKGPFNYCQQNNIDPQVFFGMESIVQKSMLKLFESDYLNETFKRVMRETGKFLIRACEEIEKRRELLDKSAEFSSLKDLNICFFLEDTHSPAFQLNEWLDHNKKDCPVTITNDDRGSGIALFRRNEDQRIDFSQIESDDRILFAHKNGFCAKTKNKLPKEEILDLIEKSIT